MAIVDRGWKRIKRDMYALDKQKSQIGLLAEKAGAHLVNIGYWNHYGTRRNGKRHVPAVPFLTRSLRKTKRNLKSKRGTIAKAYTRLLMGKLSPSAFMDIPAEFQAKKTSEWMDKNKTPHNKESTIRQKGFDDRLRQEGDLIDAIDYKHL